MTLANISQDDARLLWRAKHGPLFRPIARKLGLSNVFVREVWLGTRRSKRNRVEREFAKLGAPGFEQFLFSSSVPLPSADPAHPDCD